LGPGLLESIYEVCLCHELSSRSIPFERQVSFPITYRGVRLETGLRVDLLIDKQLVVELKASEDNPALFQAPLLSYLKLTGYRLGLLINFHCPLIKDGIKRVVL
jgi:GxxExxY protein